MSVRTILYIIVVPFTIWALDSVRINDIFKKNKYYASRILYLMISMSLSYLVVNFLMDFFISTKLG